MRSSELVTLQRGASHLWRNTRTETSLANTRDLLAAFDEVEKRVFLKLRPTPHISACVKIYCVLAHTKPIELKCLNSV